ncbi:expressed unknown protein [Seminavis robusta]|uniref:Uncharacterized protein n=1 Tax=Seminavis robusta TaxID=568900 RepID=A0A9N8EUN0_9STRA|nr:expressed unknown protein [Seminavis robusta]|eukprot:Sro1738_g294510.1 n/a (95) ;mRNA; r:9312-9694
MHDDDTFPGAAFAAAPSGARGSFGSPVVETTWLCPGQYTGTAGKGVVLRWFQWRWKAYSCKVLTMVPRPFVFQPHQPHGGVAGGFAEARLGAPF